MTGSGEQVLFKDEWKEAVLERFHSDGTYQVEPLYMCPLYM